MVKQLKQVERAEKIQKKPELLERYHALRLTRLEHFKRDAQKHQLKTGKQPKKFQPTINDMPVVIADTKIRIDLQAQQPVDVQREVQIYKLTLDNVNKVLSGLNKMGVPTTRPSDYLAEMFKSDKQMERIRTSLVTRQQTIREKMQNKVWQKRKKRVNSRDKRAPTSDKKKKIAKIMKGKQGSKKAPKMTTIKGKRKQKK